MSNYVLMLHEMIDAHERHTGVKPVCIVLEDIVFAGLVKDYEVADIGSFYFDDVTVQSVSGNKRWGVYRSND